MPEIVKPEIPDLCSFEQIIEASFKSLPTTRRSRLRRKDTVLARLLWIGLQFFCDVGQERDVTHFAALQLCTYGDQFFAEHNICPAKPMDLRHAHTRRYRDEDDCPKPLLRLIQVFRSPA